MTTMSRSCVHQDATTALTAATSCEAIREPSRVSFANPPLEDSLLLKLRLLDLHRQQSLERCSRFVQEIEAAMHVSTQRMEAMTMARRATRRHAKPSETKASEQCEGEEEEVRSRFSSPQLPGCLAHISGYNSEMAPRRRRSWEQRRRRRSTSIPASVHSRLRAVTTGSGSTAGDIDGDIVAHQHLHCA